jgi:hypothetical protein
MAGINLDIISMMYRSINRKGPKEKKQMAKV